MARPTGAQCVRLFIQTPIVRLLFVATNSKKSAAKKTPTAKARGGKPGGRPPGAPVVRKATAADWIAGARLRTLTLSIAPVVLGTASSYALTDQHWHWVRALACLALALFLQIAVNYANDYSDGIRGTDAHRVGPSRLTGSGAAKPRTVLAVSLTFFGLAALVGIAIVIETQQYWLLAVGAACIVAGWFYTGGKRPYGYYGLGEIFVFVFFGLVATVGTTYVLAGEVNSDAWLCGIAVGFLACAVLMINNLRDREQDKIAGKRTVSVLIGDKASRATFVVLLLLPFVIVGFFSIFYTAAPLAFFALLAALPAALIAITGKTAKEFILALQLTSLTSLVFGLALGVAIAF